ncbi:cell wall-binding repeat-containing protein [Euzebya tangerina]|uniref:cell wall-binding repeat-containing protein n=1 Tax=Euzebya tangerina TaxID=591198 RepID=UPI000E32119F|nr:cell wall-binding repeat-containing protein [Euzebya tangerina]
MSRTLPIHRPGLVITTLGVALMALVWLATPAAAATFDVDTALDTVDASPGDGDCADAMDNCSLRAAIQEANALPGADTVTLGEDETYALTIIGSGEEIAGTGDLDITSEITLTGNGSTIDATVIGDRAVDLIAGDAVITDLTITGGAAGVAPDDRGGAIRADADSTLDISASTLIGNTAPLAGGGIENTGGTVTVTDTDFSDNVATGVPAAGNGGAVHAAGGSTTITGGTVQDNTAVEGAGLWLAAGTMDVDGVTFTQNTTTGTEADMGGGAIFNQAGGTISVTDSSFDSNTATNGAASGGAIILVDDGTSITVTDSSFDDNAANRAGGAIEVAAGTSATIIDSDFTANDVAAGANPGNGGAIHSGNGTVSVTGGTAAGNTATEGGAFWNSTGDFVVEAVTFDGNTTAGTAADMGGGAIFNQGAGTVAVEGSNFTGNTATEGAASGGAIIVVDDGSTVTVEGSTFDGNSANRAGGAIEVAAGSILDVSNSTFDSNDVAVGANPGNGGAIHSGGGTVSVFGGSADDNTAIEGGAFWNAAGTFAVDAVIFTGNVGTGDEADNGGGALFNQGAGTMTVVNSTFDANLATGAAGSGGAVLNLNNEGQEGDSVMSIEDSSFDANVAARAGGAIENAGSVMDISDTDFSGNDVAEAAAPGNGGAIHDGGGTVTVTGGSADGNTAVEGGGFWTSGTMVVTGTTLTGNTGAAGGALYIEEGGQLTLDGVRASANDATDGDGNALFDAGGNDTATDTVLTSQAPATGLTCNELVETDLGGNADDDGSCFDQAIVVDRVQGEDRIATAIAASQASFDDGEASAVVLTRADVFADALAGTPLAVQENGPLLLSGQDSLDSATETEIQRVLDSDGTVYLLGGTDALSEQVEADVTALGTDVVRYGGLNRFDTAVIIASDGLDEPDLNLLADGEGFADAVSSGAAAAANDGAVLLTSGDVLPPETEAYLATIDPGSDSDTDTSNDTLFAIGGPAVAAVPGATPVQGANRVDTAVEVATTFFEAPPVAGIATEGAFPDALAGGVVVSAQGGPLLLSGSEALSASVAAYFEATPSIGTVTIFGGVDALSEAVQDGVRESFPTSSP